MGLGVPFPSVHGVFRRIAKPLDETGTIMSDTEQDGDISDEEVFSLLESSVREVENEADGSEVTNYVLR